MTARRGTALLVLIVAAATFAHTSGRPLIPLAVIVLGTIGAAGWVRWTIPRPRMLVILLLLSGVLALQWRLRPPRDILDLQTQGFFLYALAYGVGQFFLAVMVLSLLRRRAAVEPATEPVMPLYGVMVLICAGDVYLDAGDKQIYHALCLAFAVVAVLHFIASRRALAGHRPSGRGAKAAILTVALALAMGGGVVGSDLLRRYQREINAWLMKFSAETTPSINIGFSNTARLGSVAYHKTSSREAETALRVFSDARPGYLRGLVFHRYAKSRWRLDTDKTVHQPLAHSPDFLPGPAGEGNTFRVLPGEAGAWRRQDIWPNVELTEAMFTPLHTTYLRADVPRLLVADGGCVDSVNLLAGSRYTAFASARPPAAVLADAARTRYTELDELDPDVRALAEQIFEGKTTAAEKIDAVVAHFHRNYTYNLGIRIPQGRDALTYFLLDHRAGHCEYFATAAAVLLRVGGVPARYVVGFVAVERNDVGGYWLARNRDAHAWVEGWDPRRGWVIVEATPPAGVPQADDSWRLARVWDYVKFRLHQLRVSIASAGFRGLLLWCRDRLVGLGEVIVGTWIGRIIAAAVLTLLVRRFWRKYRLRPGRDRDPLLAAMHRQLRTVDRRVAKLGLTRQVAETLHQFAARLRSGADGRGAAAADWYLRYANLRYAWPPTDQAVRHLAERMPTRTKHEVQRT